MSDHVAVYLVRRPHHSDHYYATKHTAITAAKLDNGSVEQVTVSRIRNKQQLCDALNSRFRPDVLEKVQIYP